MEEEKTSKSKNKKLLIFVIGVLIVLGVLLITFLLLFNFGILGNEEEVAAEIISSERTDTEDIALEESEEAASDAVEGNAEVIPISVERVYEIITNNEDYFILDVRNQDEYDEAHIEGVVLISVNTLESRLSELPEDKPIIVYCKTGGRSAAAAEILVENGFTEVYDMGGGITEWIDKGYPTVSEE